MKRPFIWVPGLSHWFSAGPFPVPGYRSTLHRDSSESPNCRAQLGASIRQVIDFSDLNHSSSVLPTIEFMYPISTSFANLVPCMLIATLNLC